MRGAIPGLDTSVPFGPMLPAIYQEDEFSMRFVAGFDDVLAPVLLALDCLIDYFDPALTPTDFLEWLARTPNGRRYQAEIDEVLAGRGGVATAPVAPSGRRTRLGRR